jgi:GNAT superfamily N-acetyltransferase
MLTVQNYRGLRDRFRSFPFDRGFRAFALAADSGAVVWADDQSDPRVAVLAAGWSQVSFVWGEPTRPEAGMPVVDAARKQRPGRVSIISVPDAAWREAILRRAGTGAFIIRRVDYDAFDETAFRAGASTLPDTNLTITAIDDRIVGRVQSDCDEDFESAIFQQRGGIGYAAVDSAGRVCASVWTATVDKQSSIACATRPEYRGQGLANWLGRAVVAACLRNGVRLHVCTGASNVPARAWAHRLGFREPVEHDWILLRPA